ncbi:MAG: oligosaccharide flippase family protein [Flavobacteriales bacterium]|nr:oligosaccharide flippase family protein [Flavobacteriales bacterium]
MFIFNFKDFILIRILKNFMDKEGGYVFASSLFTKICSFLTSLILIRVLSPENFGILSYVLSALAFFIPFSGGGIQYSYLRFAPMLSGDRERNELFKYSIKRGLLLTVLSAVVLLVLVPWLSKPVGDASVLFYCALVYLFSFFLIELVKTKYRVAFQNKKYAGFDAKLSLIVLLLGCGLAYVYGSLAYLLVLACVPLFLALPELKFTSKFSFDVPENYHSYGLWVGLGAVASQLMYSLDVFLIGQFIQDSQQVALYRSASIIPLALFFIPNSYITTHYADISKHSVDRNYLLRFSKDYCKVFALISLLLGLLLYLMSDFIVVNFFGADYADAVPLFKVLLIGIVGAFVLRIPFGNLLASVGRSNWNAFVAFAILVLNGILNYYALRAWGIIGAAIVTSGLLWISGLISLILFSRYLKSLH